MVVFQRLKSSATVNGAGHIVKPTAANWETYCTRKCKVTWRSARESLTGDQLTANRACAVECYYDSKTKSIDQTMRLMIGNRVLSIGPTLNIDQTNRVVEFTAIEVLT